MLRIQDLNRAAFIEAVTGESPAVQFDNSRMASFGFTDSGRAAAALASFESGGTIEAKTFARIRDGLFRRIRGGAR